MSLVACVALLLAQTPSGAFVPSPLQPGVYSPSSPAKQSPPAAVLKALSPGVKNLTGFLDPGPIVAAGDQVYVGNYQDNLAKLVSVIDASTYGQEFVSSTFTTPVNPIDLAVFNGEIYVIDQNRAPVWHRPLAGGTWTSIALPPAISEWTYGNILFVHAPSARLFVTQFWENRIHVIDLATNTHVGTITDLHHLPTSIVFDVSRMAVLCTGLSAPSCAASGPNLAVFDLATLAKQFEVNLQGTCSRALATEGSTAYVVRDSDIRRYAINSGSLVGSLPIANLGRHAAWSGTQLLTQDFDGSAIAIDADLAGVLASYEVLAGPQIWFPPVEEMAALSTSDQRWFVTNRNDDSVSVIYHSSDCAPYGQGCAGSGGVMPKLQAGGCPYAGGIWTVAMTRALGGAPFVMFAGLTQASLPLGMGCTFLVAPIFPPVITGTLGGSGPGNGSLTLPLPMPASGLPSMFVFTLQAFVIDPGAALGFSTTNGVKAILYS